MSINVEAREILDQIAAKEPHELTKTEEEFLKARRYYLTYEMQVKFKHLLQGVSDEKPSDEDFNDVPAKLENTPTEEVTRINGTVVNETDPGLVTDAQSVIETDYSAMTKTELQAELEKRGVEYKFSANKQELIDLLK